MRALAVSLLQQRLVVIADLPELSLAKHLDELEVLARELERRQVDWQLVLCRRRRRFGIDEQQVGGGVWAHHAGGQQRITRRAALRRPRLARRVFDLVFDVAAAGAAAAVRRLSVAGERRGREGEQAGRRRGWSDHQLGRLRVSTLGRDARTCNDERTAGRSQTHTRLTALFPGLPR